MMTCPQCNRELENENTPCPDCDSPQSPKKKFKLTKQVNDPTLTGYTASEGKVTTFNLSPKTIGIIVAVVVVVGFLGGLLSGSPEEGETISSVVTSQDTSLKSSPQVTQISPRELSVEDEINSLFSKIRRANLDEDINTFMKYYAASFPDRSGKEMKTLETWQKYDFVSLDFFVFDLNVENNRAEASVGWEIALLEKGQSKPKLIETTNEVVLDQGGEGWQIVSLQ